MAPAMPRSILNFFQLSTPSERALSTVDHSFPSICHLSSCVCRTSLSKASKTPTTPTSFRTWPSAADANGHKVRPGPRPSAAVTAAAEPAAPAAASQAPGDVGEKAAVTPRVWGPRGASAAATRTAPGREALEGSWPKCCLNRCSMLVMAAMSPMSCLRRRQVSLPCADGEPWGERGLEDQSEA